MHARRARFPSVSGCDPGSVALIGFAVTYRMMARRP